MAFIFVDILDLVVGTGSSCKDSAGTEGMAFDKALATGRLKVSAITKELQIKIKMTFGKDSLAFTEEMELAVRRHQTEDKAWTRIVIHRLIRKE